MNYPRTSDRYRRTDGAMPGAPWPACLPDKERHQAIGRMFVSSLALAVFVLIVALATSCSTVEKYVRPTATMDCDCKAHLEIEASPARFRTAVRCPCTGLATFQIDSGGVAAAVVLPTP